MTSFKQILVEERQIGDYRPGATINLKSEEILADYPVEFTEYFIEGLGRAKIAWFLTESNKQFGINEYLEPTFPITEIVILNDLDTMTEHLDEVLDALNLSYADLHFIHTY